MLRESNMHVERGTSENPIQLSAKYLVGTLLEGESLEVEHATILDDWDLVSAEVKGSIVFRSCKIEGNFNVERARFDRSVLFHECHFKSAMSCRGTAFSTLYLEGCSFDGTVDLSNATCADFLIDAAGVHADEVKLWGTRVEGLVVFRESLFRGKFTAHTADFRQGVDFGKCHFHFAPAFSSCQLGTLLLLEEAVFTNGGVFKLCTVAGEVKAPGIQCAGEVFAFQGMEILGTANFSKSVFKCEVSFENSLFKSDVTFREALFERHASFRGICVDRTFLMVQARFNGTKGTREQAVFTKGNSFSNARFGESVNFSGCEFSDHVHFDWAKFEGLTQFGLGKKEYLDKLGVARVPDSDPSIFREGATFANVEFSMDVQLGQTHFGDAAVFRQAQFRGNLLTADCIFEGEADFRQARFQSQCILSGEFKQTLAFSKARVEGDLYFGIGCRVVGGLDMSFCWIRGLHFVDPLEHIFRSTQPRFDLRGCSYEAIDYHKGTLQEVWECFNARLREQNLTPPFGYKFDRQPYLQLEKCVRGSGADALAEDIVFEMHKMNGDLLPRKRIGPWIMDRVFRYFAGYGIRIRHVILWATLTIAMAFTIFSRSGAIIPEGKREELPAELNRFRQDGSHWRLGVSLETLGLSARLFLPFEIPSGRHWQPSERTCGGLSFTQWASLLKLAGWIIVPILAGELTRKLLRRTRSGD